VEDDGGVRDVILQQLVAFNYRTVHADCGRTAVDLLQSGRHVDVLPTDIVMSGELQGPELARRARSLRPHIGVVLMPGYTDQVAEVEAVPFASRLAKPFTIHHVGELQYVLQRLAGNT